MPQQVVRGKEVGGCVRYKPVPPWRFHPGALVSLVRRSTWNCPSQLKYTCVPSSLPPSLPSFLLVCGAQSKDTIPYGGRGLGGILLEGSGKTTSK